MGEAEVPEAAGHPWQQHRGIARRQHRCRRGVARATTPPTSSPRQNLRGRQMGELRAFKQAPGRELRTMGFKSASYCSHCHRLRHCDRRSGLQRFRRRMHRLIGGQGRQRDEPQERHDGLGAAPYKSALPAAAAATCSTSVVLREQSQVEGPGVFALRPPRLLGVDAILVTVVLLLLNLLVLVPIIGCDAATTLGTSGAVEECPASGRLPLRVCHIQPCLV
mmetsp:Transcript_24459/g.82030  ORF Transcript_24459/g.82030 Transcript_24459/m.82030 type:complete len:221 (-) Transcript_24459:127-789(-)